MNKLSKALLILTAIPIGFLAYNTKTQVDDFMELRKTSEALYNDVSATQGQARDTQQQFLSARTFAIPFTDTRGIVTMFKSISGFNVTSIKTLDASNGYTESGDYTVNNAGGVDGLKITFTVNDVQRALDILDSMQLPILDLSVRNSIVEVSFNTRQVA